MPLLSLRLLRSNTAFGLILLSMYNSLYKKYNTLPVVLLAELVELLGL